MADSDDHGLQSLSVVGSPDELVVWRLSTLGKVVQAVCVLCMLLSSASDTTYYFHLVVVSLIHLLS